MKIATDPCVLLAGFDASARTSLAHTWGDSWSALLEGRRRFDYPQRMIAAWPDDTPVACLQSWPSGFELKDRAASLARTLGRDTKPFHDQLLQANPGVRLTIVVATSHGEARVVSEFAEHLFDDSNHFGPSGARAILCDHLLAAFLDGLGTLWVGTTLSAACASACVATGLAAARIRSGLCDACLVVSLDVLSRVAHAGFRQIGAMSSKGSRPFDRRRDGTTIGEAGAVVLLAREGLLLPDTTRWAVEVKGFGQSCDARHPVEPSAEGVCDAVQHALAEAGHRPADLAAVYWHGTGTIQNDRTEAQAARRMFGGDVPPGTTTKGAFGHAMGASAALSILAAGETIKSHRLPPVAGLEEAEFPELNIVAGRFAEVGTGPVVIVSLGFGGVNAALVLNAVRSEKSNGHS